MATTIGEGAFVGKGAAAANFKLKSNAPEEKREGLSKKHKGGQLTKTVPSNIPTEKKVTKML